MPFHQAEPARSPSPWHAAPGAPPNPDLTPEELAHAAVLEQMAHGATYQGEQNGDLVGRPDADGDRKQMLMNNGYDPNPRLIQGADGLQMVVYTPQPGRHDVRPVVSFRGTELDEPADVRTDLDVMQVGDE